MRKVSPRLVAIMMAGAVTVTSITPVTGYQTITVNAATDSQEKEAAQGYQTNLTGFDYKKGDWKETKDGLYSNAVDKGDCFAFSKTTAKNFVYSTDVTFKRNQGAATLIFRFNNNLDNKECYAVNIDGGSHKCKLWRWQENSDYQLIDEKEVKATDDEKYTLKVVAYDSWISYYVNDTLIASTGDYTLQKDDKGQSTVLTEGSLGLLNWNGEMTFQNTYYTELNDQNTPELKNISVSSSTGDVEKAAQFTSTEPIMIQYVKNNAETVDLNIEKKNENADVQVEYDGKTYNDGKNIPVKVGKNYITVKSTVQGENGQTATLTYRVNVHRRAADKTYYNEAYRNQYHYSVKDGWGNDLNGLVKYKGTYHMFYQFYDDTKWGPMHWAHATSKDLIHWEEQPIALYPDANGAMFSGCIVADEKNTSGLFGDGNEGGLVALITADGNGQRIKVAYSTDEGKTWKKTNKIVADWSKDPLNNRDFRDPKVFRWENKWFMVIAGGPLRIYSSDNLTDWKCESTYADLHTECPDLYPIETKDGVKWVLSRGGRFYKVGDFKQVDGKWKFVADEAYKNSDGVMNFGKDSYAAMTYYVQDFGTQENPTIPEIIEGNWMNTWDDYCNKVADTVGQNFNGTYNLNLKVGLKQENGKYVLTQTPISEYESLRDAENKISYKDVTISEDNDLLKDFAKDTYEIVAKFKPSEKTKKVGFRLRKNQNDTEYTDVIYDLENEKLSIDRSKSGKIISQEFKKINEQSNVKKNEDGSVELHIYVDKASVEVFSSNNTAAGANQIFPTPTSLGASVLVEGDPVKADIDIYPMKSIWTDKKELTDVESVGSMQNENQILYAGDSVELSAYVFPISMDQTITWDVTEGKDVVSIKESDGKAVVTALKSGKATVTASSKSDPSKKKIFTINVKENNFKTNIKKFINVSGNWTIDGEVLSDSNQSANDFYMSEDAVVNEKSTIEADMSFKKGLVNLIFASKSTDPNGAYCLQFVPGSNRVRLFRMYKDGDIAVGEMSSSISDGAYHHVKIEKEANAVKVYVDDKECLNYTFDADKESDKDFFDIKTGYMGLGLWDGAVSFKNLYVDKKEETKPSEPTKPSESTKPSETPKTISVTLKGNGGKTVTTINKTKAGTKLPGWNKTKYKAAGKKGYVFTGWTYQGKVVNKVPASDKNIVLTAKFVKIKVGTAKLSSLKGKSGKGTGFVAKSIKYTNKYGEKRGFRFRYSTSKKMKSAKYKTTGLVKNIYTKTGLKKGKKYYVQVRYYYYDSTNQKVYGTYSKAKSVKAY